VHSGVRVSDRLTDCSVDLSIRVDGRLKTRGIALIDLGRADEAIAHFTEALRIDPDSATAHYNLGVVLAGRGEHEQAIVQTLRIDPAHPDARRKLDAYPDHY